MMSDMNDAKWRRLLDRIEGGFVVPVVGCRLLVAEDGESSLQAEIAQRLLASHGLEMEQPLSPFRELNEAVTRLLQKGNGVEDLYSDVHHAIKDLVSASNYVVPRPIRQLAEISDFSLFVTLTPDDLLARTLRQHRAVNEIIHSPKMPSSEEHDLPPEWNRSGEAYVLYLFGKSAPASIFAIHDEDVLEYAHNVIAREKYVPKIFLDELRQRSLMLIGCNFPEWLSRFFLRATSASRLSQPTRREWLIEQLQPDESFTCFLHSYSKEIDILSDIPPAEFVAQLHRRWMAEHGSEELPDATVTHEVVPPGAMFFISYSRQTDLPRAERLYQALLRLGVSEGEVWFDRHTIEPGQDFRHKIFAGIRSCRYFLPLLSAAANDREEAFVFDEWQAANKRWNRINREFIFPVVVEKDFLPERYTARPILDGDWVRLDFCHAPEGEPDERMTDKLKKLLRDARRTGHGD